ncbi:MAG: undecaprenyl-phosphate glucose phosphotransferase [Ignavibacteria bacterium]|nr:undecaprenyl-phosphate glucose phosphotransferase [Ignavibacteria bacterium]
MQIQRSSLKYLRIALDLLSLIGAFLASFILAMNSTDHQIFNVFLLISTVGMVVWLLSSHSNGLYDEFRSRNFSFEVIVLIKNLFVTTISLIIIIFLLKETLFSRIFILYFTLFALLLLTLQRLILRKLLNQLRKRGRNLRNLLIVGAGDVGKNFFETIHENPQFGYRVIGFLDDSIKAFLNGKYLGNLNQLDTVLSNRHIDDVIVALPNYASERLEWVITTCEKYTTRVKIIPDYFKFTSGRYDVSLFGSFPIISVRTDRINEFHWQLIKRTADLVISILSFIFIFSWLFPLIGILIKLDSKGPILFKQERWGKNNKKFNVYKFRSMTIKSRDTDKKGRYIQARKGDPRITRVGRLLRKSNLDELPQFINVLKGEMSIVGPRPHPIPLNLESKDKVRYYMLRHLVKSGITGWAQVNGLRGEIRSTEEMQKRVDYDLWYIENWSFYLDMQIIASTVFKMFKGDPNAY